MRAIGKTDIHQKSERLPMRIEIAASSKSPLEPPPISTRNVALKRNMNMSIDSAVSALNKAKVKELF